MRRSAVVLLAAAVIAGSAVGAAGCGMSQASASGTSDTAQATTAALETTSDASDSTSTTAVANSAFAVNYSDEDTDETWDSAAATTVTMSGDSIQVQGDGATAEGSTLTITTGGVYVISGSLTDGQIVVDAEDKETVRLVLNGASVNCSDDAPIYVKSAQNTIITLAESTQNTVTDGSSYAAASTDDSTDSSDENADAATGAIYCTTDLTINGSGSLSVDANYKHGIVCKDELRITNGTITVDAVGDAIRGRDLIGVTGGTFNLTAGSDGIQANNDESPEVGYIDIEGGTFTINAQNDGIQAVTTLLVAGGQFDITCGGGSDNATQRTDDFPGSSANASTTSATSDTSDSAKALKAGATVTVKGGTLNIDSADDAIHSDNRVTIEGGTLTIASGDDAVHAENSIEVTGGELTVTTCYEGLESAEITIDDGTVRLTAQDDGFNTSNAGSSTATQQQGAGGEESGDNPLFINGGYVYINAGGDGIDILGPIAMTGGTVIVSGPSDDGNGALDYQGECNISGGTLVAVGSSGMALAPSDTSSQLSLMVNFTENQAAGTIVHIEGPNGEDIFTMAPAKAFRSIVISSDLLQEGATYTVYLGGTAAGTITDTVYSDDTYTPGTENTSVTLSGVVTTSGAAVGGMGRRGGN